nr:monocarboxylate transporter 5-like isoform X2 [Cherax quadricarinatus]
MGGKGSKKLVPNRPPARRAPSGPTPTRMVPQPATRMVPQPATRMILQPATKKVSQQPATRMVAPDGGWGWMVVFGSCLTLFFFPAMTMAFGVLFRERLEQLGARATVFTVIGNGLSTFWSFMALMMAPLTELFGYRRVTVVGGLLAFLTLLLCAYTANVITFALAYSVLGGKIAMAPLMRFFLDEYGYVWACLLAGALSLNACVAGMLFQPPEWHLIPEKLKLEEGLKLESSVATTPVAITENGLVEKKGRKDGGEASVKKPEEEEDENIIFVMPTTPTNIHPPRRDDEIILFSRASEVKEREHKISKLSLAESRSSLVGSLPLLTPVEQRVYWDASDQPTTCCSDCLIVKVFRMLDYEMLRQPYFHLIAWPNAFGIFGYVNIMYALPGYVAASGYTPYQSAFVISLFSASEAVFRLVFAGLSDYPWFPLEWSYTTGFLISALAATALAMWDSYEWIIFCVLLNGASMSLTNVLLLHVAAEYLGLEKYAQAIGFFSVINGVIIVLGGSITGMVRDFSGSYRATFFWISSVIAIGAAVWITKCCYKIIKAKYKKVPVQTQ